MATSTAPSIFVNKTPTNQAWATLLLKNIGAPVTPNNINNILLWQSLENKPSNWYNRNNPLNASLGTNARDGTGSYSDLTTAAKETATMITQGYKGGAIGGGIYTALMNDAPTSDFSVQVVNSAWSSNHYGVASAGAIKAVPGRIATFLAGNDFKVPGVVVAPTTVNPGSGIAEPGTVGSDAAAGAGIKGCESRHPPITLWNSPGSSFTGAKLQLSACQGKAILGGLSIFAGGALIMGGLFMLSSTFAKTAIGKQVAPIAGVLGGGAVKAGSATVSGAKRAATGANNYRNSTKAQRGEKFANRPKSAVISKNPR